MIKRKLDGFARNTAQVQVLDGQEVKLWGYVGHSNLYGDGGPDVLAAFQKDTTNTPFWLSWLSNVAALLVANGITLLILFIGLRRSGRWERSVMVEHLRDEVGTPSVTPDEYTQIEGRCEPPRKDKTAREIFVAQCNLAKRKFRVGRTNRSVDDDPVVQAWRQELRHLRRPTPA